MPSLKEIKGRIGSVSSTLTITSAMKMVASAKLHKAQLKIGNMLPYDRLLHRMLIDLMGTVGGEEYPLMTPREVHRVAIVAFASNSSLCGAFNTNVVKKASAVVDEYRSAGFSDSDIVVYSVGRKMAEAMKKRGFPSPGDYTKMSDSPSYEPASALAQELLDGFLSGRFDKVELVYNHFESTSSQPSVRRTYLPLSLADAAGNALAGDSSGPVVRQAHQPDAERTSQPVTERTSQPATDRTSQPAAELAEAPGGRQAHQPATEQACQTLAEAPDLIIEPSPEELVRILLPKVVRLGIYTTLLDSTAAEHAARTMAMQLATDNGNELLQELTLEYNKSRQQKITSEILDLVGGSMQ